VLLAVMAGSFGFHTAKAGLASLIHGGVRFFDGLAGAFADNNDYALGAAMTLWLLLGTAQNVNARWAKLGWFLAAPLTGFMIISTFSRGGFLALVAGTITFVAFQKRRLRAAAAAAMLFYASSVVFTPPKGWTDRISTIRTYEETGESSALSRPHFWRVAVDMAMAHPLGVGLFNYSSNYDRFDTTGGEYGRSRSVHSSHFQVLAETGVIGISAYGFLFGYAVIALFRIRRRATSLQLAAEDAHFLHVTASALLASIAAFVIGGAFLSMALNDLTWLVFALVAALDRLSLQMVAAPESTGQNEVTDRTSAAVPQPAQV
jgi:probable O-glycosylation ligase (exosortase A-associated)